MSRSNFAQAKAAGANFNKAELNRSDFSGADLTGANLAKAELARVLFQSAKVTGVDFSYSNLSRARLNGLDLQGANFSGTYMFLAQIGGSDLSRAVRPDPGPSRYRLRHGADQASGGSVPAEILALQGRGGLIARLLLKPSLSVAVVSLKDVRVGSRVPVLVKSLPCL